MRILVIKQTSLGDVLHCTGHLRGIKEQFPDSKLVVLTAKSSLPILRYNPWVDEIIEFDLALLKHAWHRSPLRCVREIIRVCRRLQQNTFDLAFDLQGLARSVLFLYCARAGKKYVKGRWWGVQGFANRALHAIDEMGQVLALAGIGRYDSKMAFYPGEHATKTIADLLGRIHSRNKKLVVVSPFSRWPSKDWPLRRFICVAKVLQAEADIILTGAAADAAAVISAIKIQPGQTCGGMTNMVGAFDLYEFAALIQQADLLIGADSFPMHLASACNTPVLALFGPTDESKVGPRGSVHHILRADGCERCEKPACPRQCLARLPVAKVLQTARAML